MVNNFIIRARMLFRFSIGYFMLCCVLSNDFKILITLKKVFLERFMLFIIIKFLDYIP